MCEYSCLSQKNTKLGQIRFVDIIDSGGSEYTWISSAVIQSSSSWCRGLEGIRLEDGGQDLGERHVSGPMRLGAKCEYHCIPC